jgi:hypothetical protein
LDFVWSGVVIIKECPFLFYLFLLHSMMHGSSGELLDYWWHFVWSCVVIIKQCPFLLHSMTHGSSGELLDDFWWHFV